MAIFVTGDTHGSDRIGFHSVDGFMHRLNVESFPEQKELGKEDFVVICGDFGGVWETDRFSCAEPRSESFALHWLDARPFTTLFIPGNHENYDRLTGIRNERLLDSWFYEKMPESEKEKLRQGYPRKEWHGGFVREIRPSVLMLERGEAYDICGKTCFAFGGARSHDISGGILDPADYPDKKAFDTARKRMGDVFYRIRGLSWWDEEMPNAEEMEHGRETLRKLKEQSKNVDFVFTHDAPTSDKVLLGFSHHDELSDYLESLQEDLANAKWFYGHLHRNKQVWGQHYLLYEQIIQIA